MNAFLATLTLIAGFALLARWVLTASRRRSQSESERRLTELLDRERDAGAFEVTEIQPVVETKKDRSLRSSPTVNRLAGRLNRSEMLATGEGATFMERLDRELVLAGMRDAMSAPQALSIALLIWGVGVIGTTFLYVSIGLPPLLYGAMAILCLLYPPMKLRRAKAERQDSIKAELPLFIQTLSMAIGAKATLEEAIARTARNAELDPYDSILAQEFAQALTEYRLGGVDREIALRRIGSRTGVIGVQNLVEAIIQGLRTGSPMEDILDAYAMRARELWKQDMRTYKAKKEPSVTIGVVIVMGGGFIMIGGALMLNLVQTMQAF